MNWKFVSLSLSGCMWCATTLVGQVKDGSSDVKKPFELFLDKITVRKAFETQGTDDNKPATLALTLPKEKANSFFINAGIGYSVFRTAKHGASLTGFFVYNQNTLVEKLQKNYKLGATIGHAFDFSKNSISALFGSSSLQYLHNYVDTTHSLIVTSYWHPLIKAPNMINLGGYKSTNHIVGYFILPRIGLEYQNIIEANAKAKNGYDIRGLYGIGGNLKIKKRQFKDEKDQKQDIIDSLLDHNTSFKDSTLKKVKLYVDSLVKFRGREERNKFEWPALIEFSIEYTGRSSLFNKDSNFDNYMPLFKAGVSIYPTPNENFSVGFSYTNGANPIDGTLKQTFWLLTINFKK